MLLLSEMLQQQFGVVCLASIPCLICIDGNLENWQWQCGHHLLEETHEMLCYLSADTYACDKEFESLFEATGFVEECTSTRASICLCSIVQHN